MDSDDEIVEGILDLNAPARKKLKGSVGAVARPPHNFPPQHMLDKKVIISVHGTLFL